MVYFSSDSHNYESSSFSKGLLKVKTVHTKKYGGEAIINNATLPWNKFQEIVSSHVLCDLGLIKAKNDNGYWVQEFLQPNLKKKKTSLLTKIVGKKCFK